MGITDTAIEQLRALIASGELSPGDRLPPEAELATQLGISRGSTREAVRALTHAGMLSVKRGDGTYVSSLEPEQLLQSIIFAAELARNETVLDVVEVRRLLEPGATRLAAERISKQELAEIAQLLHAMESTEDRELFVRLDTDFHNRVALASGNAWLSAVLRGLAEPTIRARRERLAFDEEASATSRREHREIYAAMVERDGTLAEAAALAHVCSTQRGLRAVLGSAEGKKAAAPQEQASTPEKQTHNQQNTPPVVPGQDGKESPWTASRQSSNSASR